MDKERISELLNRNQELLLILGVCTSIILEMAQLAIHSSHRASVRWVMGAIEAVIYQQKPLPPFPEVQ